MAYGEEREQADCRLGSANIGKQQYDARKEYAGIGAMTPTMAAGGYGEPLRRTPIRQRIELALVDGDRAMRRADAAHRAKVVLDAHPEFAELLDALDQF
jgi:hypothetical protein